MGIRTPLPDSSSLPIGAAEVTVLDHTGAYATFPNLGKAVTPHAVLEIRTPSGPSLWRWDRDGQKPRQVISPQVATEMIYMMNKVVEEGTGKRAMLDGIRTAGKTGTTNAYRDAWFMGYTGNFVCGIWFGNDDFAPTNRMTGGSLPAMTWHDIMTYAHQGIELKNLPGLPAEPAPQVEAETTSGGAEMPARPPTLTKRAAEVLTHLERMMEAASHAMASTPSPTVEPQRGAKLPSEDALATAASGEGVR
jgi:penicillin-binding protein 1A